MDKITASPLKGVNSVRFGMERDDVRKIFGEAKEFKKSKFSKNTADDFGFCHVFYNVCNICEAIEIFGEVEVIVDGMVVFPTRIENAKKILGKFQEENGEYINYNQSIGIYAPYGKMESILFGVSGYYE